MQKTDDSGWKHDVVTFRHKILLVTDVGNLVETILKRASKDMLKIQLVIFVEFGVKDLVELRTLTRGIKIVWMPVHSDFSVYGILHLRLFNI